MGPVKATCALLVRTRELLANLGALVGSNNSRKVIPVWVLLPQVMLQVVLEPADNN